MRDDERTEAWTAHRRRRRALTAAEADVDERAVEAALRPRTLDEFIGQDAGARPARPGARGCPAPRAPPDHVLLSGPPGLGKTTLAMIIAAEMAAPLRITSGPAIQHAGDLAAILSSLDEGDVLFLDEIHRMSRPAEEMLYLAMEDFRVDVIVGKGPGATAIPLDIPPFTLVGATTRAGLLPGPLRDRFGFTGHMDFYDAAELDRIVHRSAGLLGVALHAGRRGRDRRPVPRHPADRQPAAAPGARLRPGARRRRGHPRRRPRRARRSTRSTRSASTGSTAPCSTRCAAASAAARSACRPWRSPSARSARRSRRSPSRSSCAAACSPAPRAAGWRPRPPGRTSASSPPRRTPAGWQRLLFEDVTGTPPGVDGGGRARSGA